MELCILLSHLKKAPLLEILSLDSSFDVSVKALKDLNIGGGQKRTMVC